jgi:hypothetical protein
VEDVARIEERAMEVLRIGYQECVQSDMDAASMRHIGPQLDPPLVYENFEDEQEFRRLARYLAGLGYITDFADGYLMFMFTREGREAARGGEPRPEQATTHNYHIAGDAYSPVMGEQEHVNINVSFDMRSVEVALDHAEKKADLEAGPDAEELRALLAELREILNSENPVEPGRLAKYVNVFKDHGWVSGPVISALLNVVFRATTTST